MTKLWWMRWRDGEEPSPKAEMPMAYWEIELQTVRTGKYGWTLLFETSTMLLAYSVLQKEWLIEWLD